MWSRSGDQHASGGVQHLADDRRLAVGAGGVRGWQAGRIRACQHVARRCRRRIAPGRLAATRSPSSPPISAEASATRCWPGPSAGSVSTALRVSRWAPACGPSRPDCRPPWAMGRSFVSAASQVGRVPSEHGISPTICASTSRRSQLRWPATCRSVPSGRARRRRFSDFLRREFPGRWRFEFEAHLSEGGRISDFIALWTERGVDGCCLLTFEDSRRPLDRFFPHALPKPWGQLGSIGVSADIARQGLRRGAA